MQSFTILRQFKISALTMVLWIAQTAGPAHAQSTSAVDQQFKSFYYSAQIDPRKCGANIDQFIQLLGRQNILPPNFKRVVIRAPNSAWHLEEMLIATGSRFGDRKAEGVFLSMWYFHVVGLLGGRIYDFSFGEEPRILNVGDYLREMFMPKTPVMIFGSTFRIRGKGPYYGPQDGFSEYSQFTYEVSRVDRNATATIEAKHANLSEFLGQ